MNIRRKLAVAAMAVVAGLGMVGCFTPEEAMDICRYSNSTGMPVTHARWNGDLGRIECRAYTAPFAPVEWCAYPPKSPPDNYWGKGPCNW